ncbi:MAG: HAMP domain-containing sensor histidine kinase [Nitrosotalea sp.]
MKYQKASNGFRIGASVGIIILMLGIAIALSISTTYTFSNQMRIVTDFNTPLEKTIIQMSDIQKNQEISSDNAVRYLQIKDTQGFQSSENEFQNYNNLMNNQIMQAKNIIKIGIDALPQEYVGSQFNLTLTQMTEIEELNTEYEQAATNIFQSANKMDNAKLDTLAADLKIKGESLYAKQNDLLKDTESSYQNIETAVDENKQKSLTLEIIMIISAGIISLISGYFVNQINRDLTDEVIKKTKSLQKANEKLKKLNLLKDEFISEASHELKSPLNPIYGFVELAKCGDIDKEEALSGIVKQARQIEEVANKMLDIGKIDNSRLQISIEKFNLNTLILDISEVARLSVNENVSIKTELPRSIEVEADKVRIGQVIRNILNNAIKFTHSGSILIMSFLNDDNMVEVRVSDTGMGIHPEIFPKIFNKFATKSHKRENLDGNGLGLYICKGIIDAHDGNIQAYNNPDGGATILFSIPMTHHRNNEKIQKSLFN